MRNKCFPQVRISHVLRFISICDLFTDSPSCMFRGREFTTLISSALCFVRDPLYPMDKRLGWFQCLFQQNGGLYQESKQDSPVRNQSPSRLSHHRGSEETMRLFSQIDSVSDEIRTAYLPKNNENKWTVVEQDGCSGNTSDSGDVQFTSPSEHRDKID
jgi:hypothetical protein